MEKWPLEVYRGAPEQLLYLLHTASPLISGFNFYATYIQGLLRSTTIKACIRIRQQARVKCSPFFLGHTENEKFGESRRRRGSTLKIFEIQA